jgi:hypothetical protein
VKSRTSVQNSLALAISLVSAISSGLYLGPTFAIA